MGVVVSIFAKKKPACPQPSARLKAVLAGELAGTGWKPTGEWAVEYDHSVSYWKMTIPVKNIEADRSEIMAFWYNGDQYVESCTTEENILLRFPDAHA